MTNAWARRGLRASCASGLALSAATALWLGCAGAPAWAGDDGEAPIWDSLASVVNWGGEKHEKPINYRDRPLLVLPKTMTLPPPAAAPTASATNWPSDPDIVAAKKEKAERREIHTMIMDPAAAAKAPKFQDPHALVTTDYTAGMGHGERRCVAGPGQSCDSSAPKPVINWNPLTWVGLQKKPQTVLGPEPERESLTDPPVGYRAPVEGVGAKVNIN